MKKFLLFFISILFSFLLINKVYAQVEPEPIRQPPFQEYPIFIVKASYHASGFNESINIYEFNVDYYIDGVLLDDISENDYFLVNDIEINFKKGLDRRTNSYEVDSIAAYPEGEYPFPDRDVTFISLRVTVLKSIINENYPDGYYFYFFRYDTALYVYYPNADITESYNRGYSEGYDTGRSEGYNIGYNYGRSFGYSEGYHVGYDDGYSEGLSASDPETYQRGYNDGYDDGSKTAISKFTSNFDKWIVPAIIIVVIAGIFVGYRRERYGGD